ncbi:Adenosylhomocysteinase [Lachnospiraceae bacterium TWA4]|nr:Adenosylhomocysteinase [Lachnospiraceae bacterium TWA4]
MLILIEEIKRYKPFNEQEKQDKEFIISCLETYKKVAYRENLIAHLTASAWVINKTHDKVLMIYHNIYNSWAWLGGHADGESDLLQVALREVHEESGIKSAKPVTEDIFSLEVLTVNGHVKRGNYVSSHLHLNCTYLLEADEDEILRIKPDENSGVAWFGFEEAIKASNEPWFKERIYPKLIEKVGKIYG